MDDGSQDTTALQAERAGARVFRLAHNCGYIAAIKRGFDEARGEMVVTVDADGEFPPDRIPDLLRPLFAGEADMVQGRRNHVPRFSERVLTGLARLAGPVGDSGTGFRALRTELARQLRLVGACICGIFSLEVLALGGRIAEIEIDLQPSDKPRRVAWYHIRQLIHVFPWVVRGVWKR